MKTWMAPTSTLRRVMEATTTVVSVLECTHPLEAKHIIYNPQEGLHSAADAKSRKREVPWGAS